MRDDSVRINKLKKGQRTALIAVSATLLLAVMKGMVGYIFRSEILIADAFHSGADLLAISASGFGLWLASKKKSAQFPYGLYKAETLISFFIGALIVLAGAGILKEGYFKLFHMDDIGRFPVLPAAASVISIVAAYFIAGIQKAAGTEINSQSLSANARESFLDIFTSTAVLAGIVLSFYRVPYVEGALMAFISFLILKLGLDNMRVSLLVLMDANMDIELQASIENKINEIYGVKGDSEVRIRCSGPFKMLECTIHTSPTLPLYRAHELADKTEEFITSKYENIESVFIHVEPSKEKALSAIIPVKDINGLDSKIHGHFGRAPYYVIIRLPEEGIEIEDFYYNEFLDEPKHIGIKVIKAVIRYKLDLLFTSRIGELSFYMLKENFVDIYKVREDATVKEAAEMYRRGRLEKVTAPTHPLEESKTASG